MSAHTSSHAWRSRAEQTSKHQKFPHLAALLLRSCDRDRRPRLSAYAICKDARLRPDDGEHAMNGRTRLAALAALAVLASTNALAGAAKAQSCRGARQRPSRSSIFAAAGATLCVINQLRATHRLGPLRMNSVLRSIAASQSQDMRTGRYFGDDSLSGLTPMQRIAASAYARGSRRLSVSQNIAWGIASASTPAAIVKAWMESAPHRAILLAPLYRDVGVGISLGAPQPTAAGHGAIYTLDLATRNG
jgi:uncharacterized protein YkwD